MALSIGSPVKAGVMGDIRYKIVNITFDSSYPTAGEALTPATLGFSKVYAVVDCGPAGNATPITRRVTVVYDDVNSKLQAYSSVATGTEFEAEVANGTDLSSVVQRVIVYGK